MPDVEAWAKRVGKPAPNQAAVAMAVTRYMENDPADRRTKQARAQGAVVPAAERAAAEIVTAQVDAAQTLQRYMQRIDAEVARIETVMEKDPETGRPVAPVFKDYYNALSSMSKEMRGWITLMVDIKDKLWQHEQYEKAFGAILGAVRAECPPQVLEAIVRRLQQDPSVGAALRGMGGG